MDTKTRLEEQRGVNCAYAYDGKIIILFKNECIAFLLPVCQ